MNRRHNDPIDPHERARLLASDRLDGELAPGDADWLVDHLAGCPACAATAAAYAANRALLHGLPLAEPPRDLWARTATALDRERPRRRRHGSSRTRLDSRRPIRRRRPYAWLAVLLVGALFVGRLFVPFSGSRTAIVPGQSTGLPGATPGSLATPLVVLASDVAWVTRAPDGRYAVNIASVAQVCARDVAPDCATLDSTAHQIVSFEQQPASVLLAPAGGQAAVIETSARSSGGSILVVALSQPVATPGLSPAALPTPLARATAPPTPVAPTAPALLPSPHPTRTPPAPSPSAPAGGASMAALGVDGSSSPDQSSSASPVAAVAIIRGVVVVGDAAYSPDGTWLAFSARPADGSAGPDIYVWRMGDPTARPLTSDHRSVFSAWIGDSILGSRPAPSPVGLVPSLAPGETAGPTPTPTRTPTPMPTPTAVPSTLDAAGSFDPLAVPAPSPARDGPTSSPVSFLLAPDTGQEQVLPTSIGWRPVVDPTGRWVAYWTGTLRYDASSRAWLPDVGHLEISAWPLGDGLPGASPTSTQEGSSPGTTSSGPTPMPTATPSPTPTPMPSPTSTVEPASTDSAAASGGPSTSPTPTLPWTLDPAAGETIRNWDLRWDPSGRYLGFWIADPLVAGLGQLSLVTIDPATGLLDPTTSPLLRDVPALAGFSIGDGRIAWASPPGQDGNGSRLLVLAWNGAATGQTTSDPAAPLEDILVVR